MMAGKVTKEMQRVMGYPKRKKVRSETKKSKMRTEKMKTEKMRVGDTK